MTNFNVRYNTGVNIQMNIFISEVDKSKMKLKGELNAKIEVQNESYF